MKSTSEQTKRTSLIRWMLTAAAVCGTMALAACQGGSVNRPASMNDAALEDFERSADLPPTADTLYRMGRILAAQGKRVQAEAVLASSIKRYPDFTPSYRELAELQIRTRRIDEAIATLEAGLIRSPNDPVLHNDLGMAFMIGQSFGAALRHFERAHDLVPDNARYLSNMALANGMSGDYDRALELYREVVPPAIAHHNVAVICEANGAQIRADQEFAQALRIDPKYESKLEGQFAD